MHSLHVGSVSIGSGHPLVLIAGPCVLEGEEMALRIATELADHCARLGIGYIFKGSFDKANRSSLQSPRGLGLREGLRVLAAVREQLNVPVTTDVHLPDQAGPVAEVVDLLQIPAFLCRQTDLLIACGQTGRPVNLKKGQFLAPEAMGKAAHKLVQSGAAGVMLTERGTTFGYGDLVVDMRSVPRMRALGYPVCLDATHGTQQPAGADEQSGGSRELAPVLARAGVAAGVDALFVEVHPDPERAWSDAATQLPLARVGEWLDTVAKLAAVVR